MEMLKKSSQELLQQIVQYLSLGQGDLSLFK